MKKRYAIAFLSALVFLIVAVFAMNLNKVEYSNFAQAKEKNKYFQIIGKPIRDSLPSSINSMEFSFYLTDKQGKTELVKYEGPKPMNFDLAEYVVIKGKYENNIFSAKEILTKCPSKYQNQIENQKSKVKKHA
jgi:cytochrome c-type biogenesis protein CcmE